MTTPVWTESGKLGEEGGEGRSGQQNKVEFFEITLLLQQSKLIPASL